MKPDLSCLHDAFGSHLSPENGAIDNYYAELTCGEWSHRVIIYASRDTPDVIVVLPDTYQIDWKHAYRFNAHIISVAKEYDFHLIGGAGPCGFVFMRRPPIVRATLAAACRAAREESGITLAELSHRTGLSTRQIIRISKGHAQNAASAMAVIEACGFSVQFTLSHEGGWLNVE